MAIRVVISSELPHRPLADREWLEAPPHEGANQPLTKQTPPPLLGDGIQHARDLRLELLLHVLAPLRASSRD
jgi:hypothetical protein